MTLVYWNRTIGQLSGWSGGVGALVLGGSKSGGSGGGGAFVTMAAGLPDGTAASAFSSAAADAAQIATACAINGYGP